MKVRTYYAIACKMMASITAAHLCLQQLIPDLLVQVLGFLHEHVDRALQLLDGVRRGI